MLSTTYLRMAHDPAMSVSTIIKRAREKAGMSQRDLAKKLDTSPAAVAQWETDMTKPSIENRVDLSRLLNIPFVDLVPELRGKVGAVGTTDPVILAIVEQLRLLPEPIRESILMTLTATAEALKPQSPDKKDG